MYKFLSQIMCETLIPPPLNVMCGKFVGNQPLVQKFLHEKVCTVGVLRWTKFEMDITFSYHTHMSCHSEEERDTGLHLYPISESTEVIFKGFQIH